MSYAPDWLAFGVTTGATVAGIVAWLIVRRRGSAPKRWDGAIVIASGIMVLFAVTTIWGPPRNARVLTNLRGQAAILLAAVFCSLVFIASVASWAKERWLIAGVVIAAMAFAFVSVIFVPVANARLEVIGAFAIPDREMKSLIAPMSLSYERGQMLITIGVDDTDPGDPGSEFFANGYLLVFPRDANCSHTDPLTDQTYQISRQRVWTGVYEGSDVGVVATSGLVTAVVVPAKAGPDPRVGPPLFSCTVAPGWTSISRRTITFVIASSDVVTGLLGHYARGQQPISERPPPALAAFAHARTALVEVSSPAELSDLRVVADGNVVDTLKDLPVHSTRRVTLDWTDDEWDHIHELLTFLSGGLFGLATACVLEGLRPFLDRTEKTAQDSGDTSSGASTLQ